MHVVNFGGWDSVMIMIARSLDFQLQMHLVLITTKVVNSNPAYGEVYSIQHYVIKIVSNLGQICSFLRFPPPINLTATI